MSAKSESKIFKRTLVRLDDAIPGGYNAAGIADSNIKAEPYDTEKFRR